MKSSSFFKVLAVSLAGLLASCNLPGGDTSTPDATTVPSTGTSVPDDTGGQSTSTGGGQTTVDVYTVSEAYWNANITNLGYFKAGQNLTLTLDQSIMGQKYDGIGVIESDNGKIHMTMNDPTGQSAANEMFIEPLADGSFNIYANESDGSFSKEVIPAEYSTYIYQMYATYFQPWAFSDFTYNEATHAYERASAVIVVDGETETFKNIALRFENEKFISFSYDIEMEEDGLKTSGSALIKGSKWGTTSVTFPTVTPVENIPVTAIRLDRSSATMKVGDYIMLNATVLPSNATNPSVTWTSSNEKVATVIGGYVVAIAPGDAVITATAGDCSATCQIKVTTGEVNPPTPQENPFLDAALQYKANSFVADDMAGEPSLDARTIEYMMSKVTALFFNDEVVVEDGSTGVSLFMLISRSAVGEIEYAFVGTYKVEAEAPNIAYIQANAYYSGTQEKYYAMGEMETLYETVFTSSLGVATYDAETGLYDIEGAIFNAGVPAAPAALGLFYFEKTASAPVFPDDLPAPEWEATYNELVRNTLYRYSSITTPVSAVDKTAYEAMMEGATLSFFADDSAEFHTYHLATGADGAMMDVEIVFRGNYLVYEADVPGTYKIVLNVAHVFYDGELMEADEQTMVFLLNTTENIIQLYEPDNITDESGRIIGTIDLWINFALTDEEPAKYVAPEVPDTWNDELIATRISALEVSARLPHLKAVSQCDVSGIVDDKFTVTCVMSSVVAGSSAFGTFLTSLMEEYGFTVNYVSSDTMLFVSPDGGLELTYSYVITDTSFSITFTIGKHAIVYPSEELASYLAELGVTESLPDFHVNGAVGYTFSDGYITIQLPDEEAAVNAVSTLGALLVRLGYEVLETEEQTFYISPDSKIFVTMGSSDYFVYAYIGNAAELAIPGPQYPATQVRTFLAGVTDPLPSFAVEGGQYLFFEGNFDGASSIVVFAPEGTDLEVLEGQYLAALAEAGYTEMEATITSGESTYSDAFMVSPERQLAVTIDVYADDNVIEIAMVNLTVVDEVNFITAPVLSGLSIELESDEVLVDSDFVFDGTIYAVYSDGGLNEIDPEDVTFSDIDTSIPGKIDVTLTYAEGDITVSAVITLVIVEPQPEIDYISLDDYTEEVAVGDAYEFDGTITVYYDNGDSVNLGYDEVVIEYDGDTNEEGIITVTVSYEAGGTVYQAEATISVAAQAVPVELVASNYTEGYYVGDDFFYDGELTLVYSDGSTSSLDNEDVIILFDGTTDEAGTIKVTITYGEGDLSLSVEFTLTVYEQQEEDPDLVSYAFHTSQSWVADDGAIFKVWAWGGEYGDGAWIDVAVSGDAENGYTFTFAGYDNADGFIIARLNPTVELPADWPESLKEFVWNQTGNLLDVEQGDSEVRNFSFLTND